MMRKQNVKSLIAVAVVVFVACLGGCYLGIGLSKHDRGDSLRSGGGATHAEFHQSLNLTAKQREELLPLEANAKQRESHLRGQLSLANAELAQLLVSEHFYSPKVEKAVEKIHRAMAELQKATLEHLFEMEKFLTPEQYDQLLHMAGDSLHQSHQSH